MGSPQPLLLVLIRDRRTPDPRSDMPVRDDEAGVLARVGEEMGRHTDMIDGVSVGHNKGANYRHAHR
jgi:hypothetical protein